MCSGRVLGDVEILLNLSCRIGLKGPMSADTRAVPIRRKHVVGTDGNEAGITDSIRGEAGTRALGPGEILRAVSSPAEHEDHGIWPCRSEGLRRLPCDRSGHFIGTYCASYNGRSQCRSASLDNAAYLFLSGTSALVIVILKKSRGDGLFGNHASLHWMNAPVMYDAFADATKGNHMSRSPPVMPDV